MSLYSEHDGRQWWCISSRLGSEPGTYEMGMCTVEQRGKRDRYAFCTKVQNEPLQFVKFFKNNEDLGNYWYTHKP